MKDYDFYQLKFGYCIFNSKTNGFICRKNETFFLAKEPFNEVFLTSEILNQNLIKQSFVKINNPDRLFILENDNLIKSNEWEIEVNKNYPCYFKFLKKTIYKIVSTSILFSLIMFISYCFLNKLLYPDDLILALLVICIILLFIYFIGIKYHNKKIFKNILSELQKVDLKKQ